MKILTKTVLFRNIALIFSLEKPCYLENRVSGGVPVVYFFRLKYLVEKCIRTFRRRYKFALQFLNLLSDFCNLCAKKPKTCFLARTTWGKTQKVLVKNTFRKSIPPHYGAKRFLFTKVHLIPIQITLF